MSFRPTHTVPATGLPTRPSPDAGVAEGPMLTPHLDVHVVRWWGEWAEVLCSNGWTAWVDGRYLQARPAQIAAPLGPLALIGVALVVLGGFLPWLSGGGETASAWDIPLWFLIWEGTDAESIKTGHLLVAVALVALPALARQPLPDDRILLAAAGIATNTCVLFFLRVVDTEGPNPSFGVGAFVTAAGGGLMAAEFLTNRRKRQA